MKVFVNDAPQELTEGTSLATLLKQLDLLENKGWAFAVNGSVVKKREETHKMAQANRAFAHLRW